MLSSILNRARVSVRKYAVQTLNGSGLKKISTPYIESLLTNIYTPSWVGNCFRVDGHAFYELSNYTNGGSLVYCIDSDAWTERVAIGSNSYFRPVINGFTNNGENPYAFNANNGSVYELSPTYNSNDGAAINRTRIFGPVGDGTERVFHSKIRFVFEATFDATPSTTFTGLTVDWSDDDGKTYGTAYTPSITISASTTGQLITAEVRRLGMSSKRFYRMTITGSAKYIFQGAYLEAQQGPD